MELVASAWLGAFYALLEIFKLVWPYGLGCILALVAAVYSRHRDCLLSAVIMTLGWAASVAAYLANQVPMSAIVDLFIGLYALYQARWTPPEWWKIIFLTLAMDQLFLDGAYGLLGESTYFPYAWASNFTFVMQLMAVGWVGGSHGWNNLLHRFRRIRGMDGLQRSQVKMK